MKPKETLMKTLNDS